MRQLQLHLCFCVAGAIALFPADLSAGWSVATQIGGPTSAVAADGNLAYVGVGPRVLTYDISDPASPRQVAATSSFGDVVSSVVVSGTRAYVTAGTSGLHIIDTSAAGGARLLGTWDSSGSAEGVAIEGNRAYLADGPFGLQILDVSDPAAPAPISSAFDARFAFDVALHGQYAFVAAAGAGILVADVTDPANPREMARLDTPGYARDLAIAGTTLYVADQWGGVRVVDIADPVRLTEINAIPLPSWAFAISVSGSLLHVAEGTRGLRVIDVSNAMQPRERGLYEIPWKISWKLATAGDRVMVGVRGEGVHIVDARDPATLRQVGMISPLANAQGVSVKGTLAFVGSGVQGLTIVDLADPARPLERGRSDGNGKYGWAVLADGNRAYVCEGSTPGHQLRTIDIANPDKPVTLGSLRIPEGICRELERNEGSLYMPDEFGLAVYGLSDPNTPVRTGRIELNFAGVDQTFGAILVAVVGATAFLANGTRGVAVLDVTDPANLRVIGSWSSADPPDQIKDVAYQNGLLYLVAGLPFPKLIILDVSDPKQPARIGAVGIPEGGERVAVRGSSAFIAAGSGGVLVMDMGDPSNPIQVSRVPMPGFAKELAFMGERLLVAAGDGGLVVLEQGLGVTMLSEAAEPLRDVAIAPPRALSRFEVKPVESPATASSIETNAITFDATVFPPNAPATIRLAPGPLARDARSRFTRTAEHRRARTKEYRGGRRRAFLVRESRHLARSDRHGDGNRRRRKHVGALVADAGAASTAAAATRLDDPLPGWMA